MKFGLFHFKAEPVFANISRVIKAPGASVSLTENVSFPVGCIGVEPEPVVSEVFNAEISVIVVPVKLVCTFNDVKRTDSILLKFWIKYDPIFTPDVFGLIVWLATAGFCETKIFDWVVGAEMLK